MAGVPIFYRKSAEGAISSYDWTDLSSATGYINYYGGHTYSNSANVYVLTNNAFWSDDLSTASANFGQQAYTLMIDKDFDMQYKLPQTILGDAIINIPYSIVNITVNKTYTVYPHIRIRKWDGTAETEIANASGAVISVAGASQTFTMAIGAIKMTIPQTHYKKNESLRITCELWAACADASSSGYCVLWHDPKNRATGYSGDTTPTNLIIQIPFKIDI